MHVFDCGSYIKYIEEDTNNFENNGEYPIYFMSGCRIRCYSKSYCNYIAVNTEEKKTVGKISSIKPETVAQTPGSARPQIKALIKQMNKHISD